MRIVVRLAFIFLLPIVAAVASYTLITRTILEAKDPSANEIVLVEVASGMGLTEIAKLLETKGILEHWWSLDVMGRLKGGATKILAGEYELKASMTPSDLLKKLVSGEVFKRKVTIREGVTIWEIGKFLEDAGILSKVDFEAALVDENLLRTAGIGAKSFEGYLFPETYLFSRPVSAQRIIWTMMDQGEKHWPPEFTDRADQLQLTRHQIITLASIIEKESGNFEEQPIISSVFHNRLKEGMKLQADPTVIYGIPNFDGNLTKAHLETPTPYNTYVNYGLPPGPICNPGARAIQAALYPQETDFLYFVGNGEGAHIFSTTLKDHNEAVNKFQR